MLRIGVFAKFARTSVNVLRYYADIGLLIPAHIDAETGYRYYQPEQLSQLNRILAMKNLGLSLEHIQRLLDENISVNEIRGILLLRKTEIEQTIAESYAKLNDVELRLQQIELEGKPQPHDIIVKSIPAQPYLSIRKTLPKACVGSVFTSIYEQLTLYDLDNTGPSTGVIYQVDENDDPHQSIVDMEIGFLAYRRLPKRIQIPNHGTATLRELPELPTVASLIHQGKRSSINESYARISSWMAAKWIHRDDACAGILFGGW